ncbi:MAG TPA: sugar ABC transporter substrate-binding protein, partial [bacterium]|nr:sugar ABC transporter substrate-binding protein [bacterium]
MKKILTLVLGLSLALGMAGCIRGPRPIQVATYTSDPATLKILNDALRAIESRHPGVRIELVNIPYNSFQDKITTMMAGGDAPDIISVEVNNFVELSLRGALEDLTPYFQKDGMDPKAYYPTVFKRFSPGGKIYALPGDLAPFGLVYYNKKIFDEAGVPYPTSKWSWPEPFLSVCKKLVKKDANGKVLRWAWGDPYGIGGDNFMLSDGGYYMDSETNPTRLALDSPQALESFDFRWDLIWTYHVSPEPSQIQAFNFGPGAESLFMNGQIAMMPSGIWHTPNFLTHKDLSFDVVEFPWGPHHTRGWGCGGAGYSIWTGCKNKDIAWVVLKELVGEETESRLANTGLIQPALVKVANSDAFLKSPGPE